eukprot:UN24161
MTDLKDDIQKLDIKDDKDLDEKRAKFLQLMDVRDRRYRLSSYEKVFIGDDAVKTMISKGLCKDVKEALLLGNRFLREGLFSHVTNEHDFKNEYLFYRLAKDQPDSLKKLDTGFWHIRGSFTVYNIEIGYSYGYM